jgi:hypothetical protein
MAAKKGRTMAYRPSVNNRQAPSSCSPVFIISWSFIGLWFLILSYCWYSGMVDERTLKQNVETIVLDVEDVVAKSEHHAIRGAQIVEREMIRDAGFLERNALRGAQIVERELIKDAALVEEEIVKEARLINALEKTMLRGAAMRISELAHIPIATSPPEVVP